MTEPFSLEVLPMNYERITSPGKLFDRSPRSVRSSVKATAEHCPECDQLMGFLAYRSRVPARDGGEAKCKRSFYLCTNQEAHGGKSAVFVARKSAGRKRLPDSERRTVSVATKLTDEEAAKLDQLRGQMGRGEWLREAAFKRAPSPIPEINRDAWAELSRVGGNLNQVAKKMNQGDEVDAEQVRALLDQVRNALLGVRDES